MGALADRVPPGVRAARIRVDRRGALALVVLAAVAVVVAALAWLRARPHEVAVPEIADTVPLAAPADPMTGAPDPAGPTAAPVTAFGPVVIHVAGRVVRPGVVTLPAGSRVDDAVRAAGGPLPGTDLSDLNLARVPGDGEQVAVGVPGAGPEPAAPAPPAAGGGGGDGAAAAVLDLNRATAGQLEELPGVGPVMARQIIDWRTTNGRFTSVEQLREVRGIGERRFADLRPLVRV